jgi:hypothetical protein
MGKLKRKLDGMYMYVDWNKHICAVKYVYFADANTILNRGIFVISWLHVDILFTVPRTFLYWYSSVKTPFI